MEDGSFEIRSIPKTHPVVMIQGQFYIVLDRMNKKINNGIDNSIEHSTFTIGLSMISTYSMALIVLLIIINYIDTRAYQMWFDIEFSARVVDTY